MDGVAVCQRLRAMPWGRDLPVIFLTALRDVDTFDRALRAGADDFLTKPAAPAEIAVRVHAALTLRRLRSEVREHYALLKRQRDELLRLQLQKERLTAFVVHDLKSPVDSIDLNAQLVLRAGALPAESRDAALRIRGDARVLSRMILNLLDVAKADEGQLAAARAEVDLTALVDGVFADLALTAEGRDVTLRSALSVRRLSADGDLLRRTLTNLVENAVRHTSTHTEVTVETARAGDAVRIRVTDRGPGIPEELRQRVFDPFVRLDGHGAPAGRGLGLTFCRHVVEAHGGRIWVEDAGPGAVFCLTVPDATRH
jgi:signal transduction histidine kinase